MLRGIGRVLRRALCCDGRKRYKTSVHTTHLLCSGVSGWREHGREDSQSCASCTLPVQVGVAVGGYLFLRLSAGGFGECRVGGALGVFVRRFIWRESRVGQLQDRNDNT